MPRKKRQKPSLAPINRDMGAAALTPLVGAKGGVEGYRRNADGALLVAAKAADRGASVGIVRNVGDPLDYYLHRQMISEEEHAAGDRLRRDHFSAFGSGYHAVNLDGFHGCSSAADNWRFSPFKSDRMRDFMSAIGAMPRKTARLLELVVIRGIYANEAARLVGEPRRHGFRLLKEGLAALVMFYRRSLAAGKASNPARRHQSPSA